jgi:hypothetical protein
MPSRIDISGKRYGRLTVLSFAGIYDRCRASVWRCRCDCGQEVNVHGSNLKRGASASCGCLRLERLRSKIIKHGASKTPEYLAWRNMLRRCTKPGTGGWELYGGRGIRVCESWLEFDNFLQDMGKRPSAKHTLERVNTNGNYEPSNCTWTTQHEQARNRRTNHRLTINGETLCISDWAIRAGLTSNSILARIRRGWSVEDAVFQPKGWNQDAELRRQRRSQD